MVTSDSSDSSSSGLSGFVESSRNILYSASSLPHTLDDLLAGMPVPKEEACKSPAPGSSRGSRRGDSLINLDMSDVETSASDSGSESPVYVDLPSQPSIQEHTVSSITAQVSWSGPQSGEFISFYELKLQEAGPMGQHKNIQWFCSQTEEHLENLIPGTVYLFHVRALNVAGAGKWSPPYQFSTINPIPGLPLDPPPVTITVRRNRKPQKKTIYIPAP